MYDEVLKCTVSGDGKKAWEAVSLSVEGKPGCVSRTGCSTTLVGGHMYIFAGQDPQTGTLFNDVLRVHLESMTLQRVDVKGGSPPPRHSHASVRINDTCLVSPRSRQPRSKVPAHTQTHTHARGDG